jgi:hypothetical protein
VSAAPAGSGTPVTGRVGPPGGGAAGQSSRWWRRRGALAALAAAVIAVAVVLVLTLGGGGAPAQHVGNGAPVSYSTIVRETITSQTDQNGTLGYSGSFTVSIPTGTAGSVLSQDSAAVQQDAAKVTQDERALAAARRLAGPQNAATLSAARATLASDRSGLAAARTQLAADQRLGCPPASTSTTTTALSGGSTPSGGGSTPSGGGSTPSGGGSTPSGGGSTPSSGSGGSSPSGAGHAADAHTATAGPGSGGTGPTTGAPSAQTGSVDGVSSSGATVTGSVTPDGLDTTYYFEYGTSSAFGSQTASQDAGSGANPVAVSVALSGLTSGTTYDFRLVAVNSQGTSYGQEASFTTTAGPQATTGSATPTATGATFTGTIVPGALSTSYYFEYGTTSAFGSKTPVQTTNADSGSVSVQAAVTGLKPSTTYVFALVASNAIGTSTGQTATFQTVQSSCAAQALVVREDEQAVAQARDTLTTDRLSAGSSTSQDATALANDEQTLSLAQLAYSQAQAQATNQGVRYTWLPSGGTVIHRGQAVYDLDGRPVPLLYGNVIPYRSLEQGVSAGPDVLALNENLVALGYESGLPSDQFTAQTAGALRAWQQANGLAVSGVLALGDAVFAPGALRVTSITAQTGEAVQPGSVVLQATALSRQVVVQLDAALQSEVAVGDPVSITLPDNSTTPGRVSYVGKVATSSSGSGSGGGSGGSSSPTINVYITPDHPAATGTLDDAPVTVAITTGTAPNALVVPVASLLALSGGGYAIEQVLPSGTHQLQAVNVGPVFDDANGTVQVSGSGVQAGEKIVVASS